MGNLREAANLIGDFVFEVAIGQVKVKLHASGLATVVVTILLLVANPLLVLAFK